MIPAAGPAPACLTEGVATGLSKFTRIWRRYLYNNFSGTYFTGKLVRLRASSWASAAPRNWPSVAHELRSRT
jgi:hypothetical protein